MTITNIYITLGVTVVAMVLWASHTMWNRLEQNNANTRNNFDRPSTHRTKINDNCPICLDCLGSTETRYLPCGHAMHQFCWTQYRKYTFTRCPVCNRSVD